MRVFPGADRWHGWFTAYDADCPHAREYAYTGWPDRIYLIDSHGKIAYKSTPGPFGFKPTQLGAALQQLFPKPGK